MVKSVSDASRIAAGSVVELRARLMELSLNVMMRLVAGRSSLRPSRFQEIVRETFAVSGATNLPDFLPLLRWFGFRGAEKKLIRLQEKRDQFLQELVDERRGEVGLRDGADRKCLIDVLHSLQRSDPEHYTDEIIKGLIVVLLTTGTDTSALTTERALAEVLRNPEILEEAQAELHRCVGNRRFVSESDLHKLPYLQSIKETLRLHPVAPLLPANEPAEGCTLQGYSVPKGTMLPVNAWAIHRHPAVCEEAELFRPLRWLLDPHGESMEGGKEKLRTFSFGMGTRGCPREGFAHRVVSLGLGTLLQCFDWDVIGGEAVDLSEGHGLSMPMATPLGAICGQRQILKNSNIKVI